METASEEKGRVQVVEWEKLPAEDILKKFDQEDGEIWNIRTFFNMMRDPAFLVDRKGRILYSNKAALAEWGLKPDAIRGQSIGQALGFVPRPNNFLKVPSAQNEEVIALRQPRVFLNYQERGDGKKAIYQFLRQPFLDSEHHWLIAVVIVSTTDRRGSTTSDSGSIILERRKS